MRLYGKDNILRLVGNMLANDRLSHTFIIQGEKGMGRLSLAKELAKMMLCQGSKQPCGVCKSCRMLESGGHPDLNILVPGGKQENFKADDLRFLISDAQVSANEGGRKVYILPEIDKSLATAQNVLLKIIEEPPKGVVFIMTAVSKEKILPTVQSRSVLLSLPPMSESDCAAILTEKGYDPQDADKAVSRMGANPGRCIDYLEGSGDNQAYDAAERILDGMISADEYLMARELSGLEGDRSDAIAAIELLQSVVRDAIVIKQGSDRLCSPMKDKARMLSQNVRSKGLENMYSSMGEAIRKITGSGNMSLTLADLACKLKSYSLT